ncbi:ATP-binding protein [Methanococcus maripaludis]|uniref:Replicative DNA helicase Mcm n=1 Tax=Methanococcus maripaludis TaxID=39152 RepID=A0A8T4CM71_METMI|nr:minichromosome maintenance protein MCM [Methanococcus maripaludis]MBM7409770.1 replicative DNA helicase Mcm [Methanococcus maripaludis]MBP2219100.1 replicative DNA helicase Mcm [Methanococcus maripaludis]
MDDKQIQNIRPRLTECLKTLNFQDIISEKKKVAVDIDNIYKHGVIDFIEFLEEFPKEGIELLEECYSDAYYSIKTEKPDIVITVKNIPEEFNKSEKKQNYTIEDIKSGTLGKLIEFEGIIVIATKIKSALKKATYVCTQCGEKKIQEVENPFEAYFEPPCPKCAQNMTLIEDESEYIDFQEIKVQQPLDSMGDPEEPPKYITVFLEHSPGIYCGRVKVTGIPIKNQKNKNIPIYDIYVKGINCEVLEDKIEANLNEEDIKNIEKVGKNPKVIDILSERMIPEIKGYEIIKKAIFLQQVKGVKKGNKRADSHLLLITDPGIGKSVMLRKIAEIPGNLYGSATTASGVGLTAAVIREKTEIGDDTWVIKPGLLVKANKGTACIDELTVNRDLQTFVLEAMESQTIHVSKGGINAKLPSECAIIAACNPRWGRFDPNVSIPEQINIPAPMLSRFDLIFPIKDEADRSKDKDIAQHIINVHRAYLSKEVSKNMKLDHIIVDDVLIDRDFVIKYIEYAKTKSPIISESAEKLLTEFYLNMRKGSVQITARQLEAAIRIAEAHAKAKLKDVVDEEDANEAISIITESLKETAYDPETGQFDVDKISGVGKKDRSKMMGVYDLIKALAEKSDNDLVIIDEIVEAGKSKGIDEEHILLSIKKLKSNGDIDEPKTGKFRII